MKKLILFFSCIQSFLVSVSQPLPSGAFTMDTASFLNGKLPVTNILLNDRNDKIQFAIIADINGGNIPGIMENAREKLNKLQPPFVMSVGDLVDGYTRDSALAEKQWLQFNTQVQLLKMPFFYVSGNHDVSNEFLKQQWNKRFGRTYYNFLYKNALFLVLDTEDGKTDGISNFQSDYIAAAIANHQDVRWTFVFMHRPLWSYGNEAGYEKIESALKGRNYTVFSGHHHNYLYGTKDGQKHFVLATTGGGTNGRGAKFGEFHHLTWVTLAEKEPEIINISLDGLVLEDIVSTDIYPQIQALRTGNWLHANPIISANRFTRNTSLILRFNNLTHSLLTVSGKMPVGQYWQCTTPEINVNVPANSNVEKLVDFESSNNNLPLDLDKLSDIECKLTGTYELNGQAYQLDAATRLKVDWTRVVPAYKTNSSILNESDKETVITVDRPEYVEEDWDWHGKDDGLLKFRLQHDKSRLYVDVLVKDDIYQLGGELHDRLQLFFQKPGEKNVSSITIYPSLTGQDAVTTIPGFTSQSEWLNKSEWLLKINLPLQYISDKGRLRFNISYKDVDDVSNTKPSIIFWKPRWDVSADYPGSGNFILK